MTISFQAMTSSILCAFVCGACAGAAEPDSSTQVTQHTLAVIDVQDSRVRFEELEGGQVALVATRTGAQSVLSDPQVRGLDPAEKYEYWTGDPAPRALSEAVARSLAALEDDALAPAADGGAGVEATIAPLNADDFENEFCGISGDRVECYTDRTGSGSYASNAYEVRGTVDAVRGSLDLELRMERAIGGWQSRGRWTVLQGQIFDYQLTWKGVAKRPLGVRIIQAEGGAWHLFAEWFIYGAID
jgi:hypothetical protein